VQFAVELWKPILFSGLAVFILSALVWTVFPHHKTEWKKLPNEDAVRDAIRAGSPAPGLYAMPYCRDGKELNSPEMKAKMDAGPVAYLTLVRNGAPAMGPMMAKSVVFNLIVSLFVAYVAFQALPPGAEYLEVFRITGTIGFMACGLGVVPDAIWFGKPWKSVALHAGDALLYGLVIGGFFGWLWP
jgi:hypothetical protein